MTVKELFKKQEKKLKKLGLWDKEIAPSYFCTINGKYLLFYEDENSEGSIEHSCVEIGYSRSPEKIKCIVEKR